MFARLLFLRFSLLSLLLTVSLICVSVSHVQVSRKNQRLAEENRHLKTELGYIDVQDPKKAYVLRLESPEPLTWRFRVYLPPGKTYFLNRCQKWVESGFPQHASSGPFHYNGPFTLTASLYEDADGWGHRISMPRSGGAGWSHGHGDEMKWLSDHSANRSNLLRGQQQKFDPESPIPIMRLRAYAVQQGVKAESPAPGFMIWFDPNPARRQSQPPKAAVAD